MLLTEQQAKLVWCPMVRVTVGSDTGIGQALAGVNDGGARPDTYNCIGPRCAMWRWHEELRLRHHVASDVCATVEPPRPPAIPADWTFYPFEASEGEPAGWTESEESAKARRRGFCGLAGKPWAW